MSGANKDGLGVFTSQLFGMIEPAVGVDATFSDVAILEKSTALPGNVCIEITPPEQLVKKIAAEHTWIDRDAFLEAYGALHSELGELRFNLLGHWVKHVSEMPGDRALPNFDLEAASLDVGLSNDPLPPFYQDFHLRFEVLSPALFAPLWMPESVRISGGWNAWAKDFKRDCVLLNIANDGGSPGDLSRIFFCVIDEAVTVRLARIESLISGLGVKADADRAANPLLLDFLFSFNAVTAASVETALAEARSRAHNTLREVSSLLGSSSIHLVK